MRALIVYCHPSPKSFNAAIRDAVIESLEAGGAETRLIDLYASGFDPVLSARDWAEINDTPANEHAVAEHVAALRWADALVFVYPTWWYGLPAMLKGWLDRTLLPGVAFELPENAPIRPSMTHIRGMAVFTTCGASWWWTRAVGAPGRKTLLRGVRALCHPRARTCFVAHYLMDASTPESRANHLERVRRAATRFVAGGRSATKPAPKPAPQTS